MRLCAIAAERWAQIYAAYYNANPPLLRRKPHEYLNMVYSWCIERVKADELDDWLTELEDLLPWQDATSEAAVNAESESFMSMMAKKG